VWLDGRLFCARISAALSREAQQFASDNLSTKCCGEKLSEGRAENENHFGKDFGDSSPSSHPIPNSNFRHANERIGKHKSR
jgi:hypothetical protein